MVKEDLIFENKRNIAGLRAEYEKEIRALKGRNTNLNKRLSWIEEVFGGELDKALKEKEAKAKEALKKKEAAKKEDTKKEDTKKEAPKAPIVVDKTKPLVP